MAEMIWLLVGFILTLLIFSYLLGDNPLFRLGTYLLVGVTAGYSAALVIDQVILKRLVVPLLIGPWDKQLLAVVPLLLGLLLFSKLSPSFARLGNLPVAYMVGVGAAVAVGGAVTGTIFGQVSSSIQSLTFGNGILALIQAVIVLLGAVSTLVYFQFSARRNGQEVSRPRLVEWIAKVGQVFIGITLGAVFAGVYASALTTLIQRLEFLMNVILELI
ncbi:MAG TPA: hypothetical protein VIO61_05005 [Anaerolineaceae bacterium]